MQLLPPQMYSKQRLLPGYRLLAQLGHAVAEEASHAVNGGAVVSGADGSSEAPHHTPL